MTTSPPSPSFLPLSSVFLHSSSPSLTPSTKRGSRLELYRILKIRIREPRLLSVFSKSGPVNQFFGSFSGLLEGLLAKRPGVLGLQLSKLAKDPDSRILRTRIRYSSTIQNKSANRHETAASPAVPLVWSHSVRHSSCSPSIAVFIFAIHRRIHSHRIVDRSTVPLRGLLFGNATRNHHSHVSSLALLPRHVGPSSR